MIGTRTYNDGNLFYNSTIQNYNGSLDVFRHGMPNIVHEIIIPHIRMNKTDALFWDSSIHYDESTVIYDSPTVIYAGSDARQDRGIAPSAILTIKPNNHKIL